MRKYRIWNATTRKWVLDEEGQVCECLGEDEALEMITKLNNIKQLNPDHVSDIFHPIMVPETIP